MKYADDDFEEDDSTVESNLRRRRQPDSFRNVEYERFDCESRIYPLKHNSEDCDEIVTDVEWERIGLFLGGNTNLKQLCILCCNLTATGMASLFDQLTASALERICICGNNFGKEGIRSLAPHLRGHFSLKHLDLSNSTLNPEAATLLSEALPVGSKLEILDLSHNTIGDAGVKILSSVLNICAPHLETLFLSHNGIGKDGCNALAQLLRKSDSSLKCLDLEYNEIDDDCARVLADALKKNRMLKAFWLDYDAQITDTGWSCFLDLVSDTASFTTLYQSNHTLGIYHSLLICNVEAQSIKGRLKHALDINGKERDSNKAGREKIRDCVRGKLGEFNSKPLVGVDAKIIPHVFGWINRECDAENRWNAVYRILRDLPSLREYAV